jgi:hypothetical protein
VYCHILKRFQYPQTQIYEDIFKMDVFERRFVTPRIYPVSTETLVTWKSQDFERTPFTPKPQHLISITQPSLTNHQITTQIPINNDMITPTTPLVHILELHDTSPCLHFTTCPWKPRMKSHP